MGVSYSSTRPVVPKMGCTASPFGKIRVGSEGKVSDRGLTLRITAPDKRKQKRETLRDAGITRFGYFGHIERSENEGKAEKGGGQEDDNDKYG